MMINATNDVLASILFLRKEYDGYPEPYRSQPELEIRVTISEYKKFIEEYLSLNDYLATDTKILHSIVNNDRHRELCQCFYKDMAYAVMKELWFTEEGSHPTLITHEISGAEVFDSAYINTLSGIFTSKLARAQNALIREITTNRYQIPVKKLIEFESQVKYATLLYAMSSPNDDYGVVFQEWSYGKDVVL